jgi:branched-chain amino acid transport system substrate-binding protein
MACAANSFAGRIVAERRARHRASSISDAIIGRLARLSVVHQSESTMISSGQIPLRGALALVAFLAFLSLPAHAQLKIGISGPLEGKNAGSMLEILKGAEIYVQSVNQAGGIHGQKVVLVPRNDNFEVPRTVAVVKQLIEQDNVLALMLVRGTPHNEAILPLLAQHKVALIGPSTGAMVFHHPVNPYVFNVRTAYQLEAKKLIALLKTTQMHKIAVLYVSDGFGKDVLTGLIDGFTEAGLQPTAVLAFDRDASTKDSTAFVLPHLPQLLKAEPEVVIVVGAGLAVKNATFAIRAAGSNAKIATLSNNASTAFIKMLGEHARGVIVSQVFPDERDHMNAFVREAQIAAHKDNVTLMPGMMEGFAAAKVAVQALRTAGPTPTRASVLRALESMDRFDMGSVFIGYSPKDHTGLELADLSIIARNGSFLR